MVGTRWCTDQNPLQSFSGHDIRIEHGEDRVSHGCRCDRRSAAELKRDTTVIFRAMEGGSDLEWSSLGIHVMRP
jgi:hypothetical protein